MKCTKCGSLDNQVNNTRTRLSTRGHNIDTKKVRFLLFGGVGLVLFVGINILPMRSVLKTTEWKASNK